jgi:hypothetical protein
MRGLRRFFRHGDDPHFLSTERVDAMTTTTKTSPASAAANTTAAAKGKASKAATPPTAAGDAKAPAKATTKAKPKKPATRAKQGGQKASKAGKPKPDAKPKAAKRPSGLDAAARVLAESKEPMGVREIVKVAFAKGYWKSDGQTPHATIYSSLIREIAAKGKDARFKKTGRGRFTVNK